MNEKLRVKLEYEGLEAEMEGDYNSVWKSVNEFLTKLKEVFHPQRSDVITVEGKDTPEIINDLIKSGYFDKPKTTKDVYRYFEELGKTDLADRSIRGQLKNFVEKGKLKRKKKGKSYFYLAPWSDMNQFEIVEE